MSLRKPYFIVGQRLQPLHLFQIHLLIPFVLSEYIEEVLALCSVQNGGAFREVWHKQKHEERDEDGGELPAWSGEYDRWLDFVRAGLETWTPWLWRAAAMLAPCGSTAAQRVKWWHWASCWELGVDTDWAVRALRAHAPGGRSAAAAIGRAWPFQTNEPHRDPLVLAPLQDEHNEAQAQAAFETASKALGGVHSHAGRNVLVLRDWVRGRAGLTK